MARVREAVEAMQVPANAIVEEVAASAHWLAEMAEALCDIMGQIGLIADHENPRRPIWRRASARTLPNWQNAARRLS
jgi:hypothetical protein